MSVLRRHRIFATLTALVVFVASVHCVCPDASAAPAAKPAQQVGHDCCRDTQQHRDHARMPGHSKSCTHCASAATNAPGVQSVALQHIDFDAEVCCISALPSQYTTHSPSAVASFLTFKPSSTLLALNCALNT